MINFSLQTQQASEATLHSTVVCHWRAFLSSLFLGSGTFSRLVSSQCVIVYASFWFENTHWHRENLAALMMCALGQWFTNLVNHYWSQNMNQVNRNFQTISRFFCCCTLWTLRHNIEANLCFFFCLFFYEISSFMQPNI